MDGEKHDKGKPRPQLVLGTMAQAVQAVIEVAEHGARKYSPDNWLKVPNALDRYTDAMLRHLLADLEGEERDKDSGLLHAAHAAWGALARLELMLHTVRITSARARGVEEVLSEESDPRAALNARMRELLPEGWLRALHLGHLHVTHQVSSNRRWFSLQLRGRCPDPLYEVEADTLDRAVHMLIMSPGANARLMELGL